MIKNYLTYIKESSNYIQYIKENISGSLSLYNRLNSLSSSDKKEIIEVLKRVFIEVDNVKLLTPVKKFFSEYCNFIMSINMKNSLFREGNGFSYTTQGEYNGYNEYKKGDYMARWGEWEKLKDYRQLWDYKLNITEFAQIVNSLDVFNITIEEHTPVTNEVDPYGEENWDE